MTPSSILVNRTGLLVDGRAHGADPPRTARVGQGQPVAGGAYQPVPPVVRVGPGADGPLALRPGLGYSQTGWVAQLVVVDCWVNLVTPLSFLFLSAKG